jgi:hypothetical protein
MDIGQIPANKKNLVSELLYSIKSVDRVYLNDENSSNYFSAHPDMGR